MNASTSYLNPVELLGLADQPALSASSLRKAKKRFLTELESDGKEDFDFHGRLFTRNDLDQVTEAATSDSELAAYAKQWRERRRNEFRKNWFLNPSLNSYTSSTNNWFNQLLVGKN